MRRLRTCLIVLALVSGLPLVQSGPAHAAAPFIRVSVPDTGGDPVYSGNTGASLGGEASMSLDGRFVAFSSHATNLVASDTNGAADVFVRDRDHDEDGILDETDDGTGSAEQRTIRVSLATNDAQANAGSNGAAMSSDGRFVAFLSGATNLVTGDSNFATDAFVRDRDTDEDGIFDEPGDVETVRVNVSTAGDQATEGVTGGLDISGDGRQVAFVTPARLEPTVDTTTCAGNDQCWDVYVHDRDTDFDSDFDEAGNISTKVMNTALDGSMGQGASIALDLSPSGRYVAFVTRAGNLPGGPTSGAVYVRDRDTDTDGAMDEAGQFALDPVSVNGGGALVGTAVAPSISDDGRYVAFGSDAALVAEDLNGAYDVYVRDRNTDTTTLESLSDDGSQAAFPGVAEADLSGDGQWLAFQSSDPAFHPDGNPFEQEQVYLRDLATDLNAHMARGTRPDVGTDGRYVAFESLQKAVAGDADEAQDVYLYDREGASPIQTYRSMRTFVKVFPSHHEDHFEDLPADGSSCEVGKTPIAQPLTRSGYTITSSCIRSRVVTPMDERQVVLGPGSVIDLPGGTDGVGLLVADMKTSTAGLEIEDGDGNTLPAVVSTSDVTPDFFAFRAPTNIDSVTVTSGTLRLSALFAAPGNLFEAQPAVERITQPQFDDDPMAVDEVTFGSLPHTASSCEASVTQIANPMFVDPLIFSDPHCIGVGSTDEDLRLVEVNSGGRIELPSGVGKVLLRVHAADRYMIRAIDANGEALTISEPAVVDHPYQSYVGFTSAAGIRRIYSDIGSVQFSALYLKSLGEVFESPSLVGGGEASTLDGAEATPSDPVETAVSVPASANFDTHQSVSVVEKSVIDETATGWQMFGQQVDITAPVGTAEAPLVLSFYVDASQVPAGTTADEVAVFRNGAEVADCAVDAGSSASPDPCIASATLTGSGDLEFTVRTSAASAWNLGVSDTTAPTASFGSLPTFSLAKTIPVAWNGTDVGSGIARFQVQRRTLPSAFAAFLDTPLRSSISTGSPGKTYCFRVRSRDHAQNYSPYTAQRCTALPIDDRSLSASGTWAKKTDTRSYLGTYRQAKSKGASLSATVTTKRLSLVVTRCPGCGKVIVKLGNTVLKEVSLASSSTTYKTVIPIKTFTTAKKGTVKIIVSTSGKVVRIDGLASFLA